MLALAMTPMGDRARKSGQNRCPTLSPSHTVPPVLVCPGGVGPVEASFEPEPGLAVLAGGAVCGVVEHRWMRSHLDQSVISRGIRVELGEVPLPVNAVPDL